MPSKLKVTPRDGGSTYRLPAREDSLEPRQKMTTYIHAAYDLRMYVPPYRNKKGLLKEDDKKDPDPDHPRITMLGSYPVLDKAHYIFKNMIHDDTPRR